jgi:predicted phage baseplate assembly protein
VTLIETFAMMLDQVMYRLNRVPELHYLRFLELIGVRPYPPTAAGADLTFWLASPARERTLIEVDTEVATAGTEVEAPVVFTTTTELVIPPCTLAATATAVAIGGEPVDHALAIGGFECFGTPPRPGDTLLFGLSEAAGSCAVLLRLDCTVEGVGVDPTDPPLLFEAWTADGWRPCEVDSDTTGGFNRTGDIVLHLPRGHLESLVGRRRAAWIACRVTEPDEGQPFYSRSPVIRSAVAMAIGGTTAAVHALAVRAEGIGTSEGVAGQHFQLQQTPVVGNVGTFEVEVSSDEGWQRWQTVETFAYSSPTDRHVTLDPAAGEVRFGPAVRMPDGTLRQYGAVPPKGAILRVPEYRTGGGQAGNVSRDRLRVLRTPVQAVRKVTNRAPALGGVDGESVEQAAVRGPLVLRTRERAVTAADYEQLTREAAPEMARVRCVPAGEQAARVLVVPAVAKDADGRLTFAELRPTPAVLDRIAAYLDERRCLGARVVVEPPFYQGVTVVARIRAFRSADLEALTDRALRALFGYFDPLTGGPDGTGWPFGRPVQNGEVFAVLQRLAGVDLVDDVRLFGADPITGDRGGAVTRIELAPNALAFSFQHQVKVTAP